MRRAVFTPAGTFSVFGFTTPIPHPFGLERAGYLVTDMDTAIRSAKANDADLVVAPFKIPLDAMPSCSGRAAFIAAVLALDCAELRETRHGPRKQGVRVTGSRRCVRPRFRGILARQDRFRRPERTGHRGGPAKGYLPPRADRSTFGKIAVLVTDGQLSYPYGREMIGYEVTNIADTVSKAKAAGATILVDPYTADRRQAAIVSFPGGYIAEIHSAASQAQAH
jgi:hypothetical protein